MRERIDRPKVGKSDDCCHLIDSDLKFGVYCDFQQFVQGPSRSISESASESRSSFARRARGLWLLVQTWRSISESFRMVFQLRVVRVPCSDSFARAAAMSSRFVGGSRALLKTSAASGRGAMIWRLHRLERAPPLFHLRVSGGAFLCRPALYEFLRKKWSLIRFSSFSCRPLSGLGSPLAAARSLRAGKSSSPFSNWRPAPLSKLA